MSLTLEKLQKLRDAQLVAYLEGNAEPWVSMARRIYQFLQGEFPPDETPRPDDVLQIILPILRVNPTILAHFDERGLKQQYWFGYFADLILDTKWVQIRGGN
jgi:hypothetical protein